MTTLRPHRNQIGITRKFHAAAEPTLQCRRVLWKRDLLEVAAGHRVHHVDRAVAGPDVEQGSIRSERGPERDRLAGQREGRGGQVVNAEHHNNAERLTARRRGFPEKVSGSAILRNDELRRNKIAPAEIRKRYGVNDLERSGNESRGRHPRIWTWEDTAVAAKGGSQDVNARWDHC